MFLQVCFTAVAKTKVTQPLKSCSATHTPVALLKYDPSQNPGVISTIQESERKTVWRVILSRDQPFLPKTFFLQGDSLVDPAQMMPNAREAVHIKESVRMHLPMNCPPKLQCLGYHLFRLKRSPLLPIRRRQVLHSIYRFGVFLSNSLRLNLHCFGSHFLSLPVSTTKPI